MRHAASKSHLNCTLTVVFTAINIVWRDLFIDSRGDLFPLQNAFSCSQ